MSVNQFFGAYYFDSPVVTAESYRHLLTKYFLLMLLSSSPNAIFLQEGAAPRYSLKERS